jgi:hypothetical protein
MSSDALELVIETAKEGVRHIEGEMTKPTDDWEAVLIVAGPRGPEGQTSDDGSLAVTVVGIDPHFMASELTKDVLATSVFPDMIRQTQAEAVAFVSSAWYSMPEPGQPRVPPSEDPNRKEGVFIDAMTADEHMFCTADIVRTTNTPPMLTQWDDKSADMDVEGRFNRPMIQALRAVRDNN